MAGKLASDRRPHDDFFQDLSAYDAICLPSGFLYYCHYSFWLALMKNAILLFFQFSRAYLAFSGSKAGKPFLSPSEEKMITPVYFKKNTVMARFLRNMNL
jgi:hypothetical protein